MFRLNHKNEVERLATSENGLDKAERRDGTSQTMRALLALRELLLEGEFKPGTRMSELPLVDRLGVSRTPVRLALATLEHEGLLESMPGGGYAVREFTPKDAFDAIELRGVLEATAARFSAERGIDADLLEQMRATTAELDGVVRDSGDDAFFRYLDLNKRFHLLLLKGAASPVLERALERIVTLPFASASAFVLAQAELPESREILVVAQDHHRGIVQAITRREGSRAEALGREHALLARRNLEIVLRDRSVLERLPGASLITQQPATARQQSTEATSGRGGDGD